MNEPFDKKVLLATALLVGWLLIYFTFLAPKQQKPATPPPDQQAQQQPAQPPQGQPAAPPQGTPAPAPAASAPSAAPAPAPAAAPGGGELINLPEEDVHFQTAHVDALLTSRGGRIKSWKLLDYRQTIQKDSPPVQMVPDVMAASPEIGDTVLADDPDLRADLPMRVEEKGPDRAVFAGTTPAGLAVRKTWSIDPDGYAARLVVSLTNGTGRPLRARVATDLVEKATEKRGGFFPGCGGAASINQRQQDSLVGHKLVHAPTSGAVNADYGSGVGWTGFADNYFLAGAASADKERSGMSSRTDPRTSLVSTTLFYEPRDLPAGGADEKTFVFYLGPKTRDALLRADSEFEKAQDFGWFEQIAFVLGRVLKFFYRYVHNWGVAIVLLTLAVKILLYPLTLKSFKSMADMQRIQPLVQQLREKYKEDRTKMNEAMMRLYKEHGINPAGGCLPMILQLPIFVAFYRTLQLSIELRHAPFLLWIKDLSAPDPYYVTPLVMGFTQWLSQRLTPTTGDPAQAKMMQLMPVVFTFLFLQFPSGLVLYWLVNNVLTIAQQQWIRRGNPVVPIAPPVAPAPAPEATRRKKAKKA